MVKAGPWKIELHRSPSSARFAGAAGHERTTPAQSLWRPSGSKPPAREWDWGRMMGGGWGEDGGRMCYVCFVLVFFWGEGGGGKVRGGGEGGVQAVFRARTPQGDLTQPFPFRLLEVESCCSPKPLSLAYLLKAAQHFLPTLRRPLVGSLGATVKERYRMCDTWACLFSGDPLLAGI